MWVSGLNYKKERSCSARYVYKWALDKNKKRLEQKEKLFSWIDLHKLWVSEIKSVHTWTFIQKNRQISRV